MTPSLDEWVKQAEYDLNASERMLESNLPAHATFTIHLALEKILKACYVQKTSKNPPKTHSLLFLAGAGAITLPKEGQTLLEELEGMGIQARYPPDLDQTLQELSKERVQDILMKAKQVFLWIKTELKQ
jgi:HEPN domain-containing protein